MKPEARVPHFRRSLLQDSPGRHNILCPDGRSHFAKVANSLRRAFTFTLRINPDIFNTRQAFAQQKQEIAKQKREIAKLYDRNDKRSKEIAELRLNLETKRANRQQDESQSLQLEAKIQNAIRRERDSSEL